MVGSETKRGMSKSPISTPLAVTAPAVGSTEALTPQAAAERDQIFRQLVDRDRDAEQWLEHVATAPVATHFAIEVEGKAIGGIGVVIGQGIFSKTAEFGYWMAEPYWGRGIATTASLWFSRFIMTEHQLHRLQAYVFAWNPGSMRVLEKCGFVREAVLRRSAVKDGQVVDEVLYALTDERLRIVRAPIRIQADCQREREIVVAVPEAISSG